MLPNRKRSINQYMKGEYFDRYVGIYTEISQATRFDESTDLSTTYLGRIEMTRDMTIKVEEKFPISGQEYTSGKLLDNTECSILLVTGTSKSCMSKSYYMHGKSLHVLRFKIYCFNRAPILNNDKLFWWCCTIVKLDSYPHR